jgi:hypothetical protein
MCCTACKALMMTLFLYILWCFGRDKREEARQESKPGKVGPFWVTHQATDSIPPLAHLGGHRMAPAELSHKAQLALLNIWRSQKGHQSDLRLSTRGFCGLWHDSYCFLFVNLFFSYKLCTPLKAVSFHIIIGKKEIYNLFRNWQGASQCC